MIGHRGAAAVRPENTIPSFEHALALGVDAVEFDVRVTADGVAVVHHDASTARTCGEQLVVHTSPVAALRSLDAGAVFNASGATATRTRIPLLDEVLELTRGVPVIVECKTVEAAPMVIAALRAHDAVDRAIVGSFLHGVMRTVRVERERPEHVDVGRKAMRIVRAAHVASGASRRDMIGLLVRGMLHLPPKRFPCEALCIPEQSSGLRLPLAQLAAWGRPIGVPVHVWTVNRAADALRLWDAGVTGVLTDDPQVILAARATRPPG